MGNVQAKCEDLHSIAIRYVVRDMGNGVDRVEFPILLGIDQAKIESKLEDRMPMNFCQNERYHTLSKVAFLRMGFEIDGMSGCVIDGVVRPVDENAVEVMYWFI